MMTSTSPRRAASIIPRRLLRDDMPIPLWPRSENTLGTEDGECLFPYERASLICRSSDFTSWPSVEYRE